MYTRSAICFLLILLATHANAQVGSIKGKIRSSDGQPAQNVNVSIKGLNRTTATDTSGNYLFRNIRPGSYTLFASFIGLETQTQSVPVVADATTNIDFTLKESQHQLNGVIVTGNRSLHSSEYVARMPLTNLENPQVYSVISNALMKQQNVVDYRTALRNAAGTSTVAQAGNGRAYTYMRGFITGNWVRNGLAAYQFSAIDPANIDRIEVIKGPSGTLFSNAVISYGGLINRVTKKPADSLFAELAYTGGSFGLNRITGDFNIPLNDSKTVLLRVNAAYHSQNSFQDAGFERNWLLSPSLTCKVNDRLSFNIDAELYQRHTAAIMSFGIADPAAWAGKSFKDIPIDYFRSYQGNDIDTKLTNYNLYAQANYRISEHFRSQTLFTYNGVHAPDQKFLNKTIVNATTMLRNVARLSDRYHSTEIQQNFNADFNVGSIKNKVLLGFDYNMYRQDPYWYNGTNFDQINYTQSGNFFVSRTAFDKAVDTLPHPLIDQKSYNSAVYLADVINFTDRLSVLASVRLDHNIDKGYRNLESKMVDGAFSKTKASPKFGVIYQVIKGQLSAFSNYQNGFSYTSTKDQSGKVFKPEQAYQFEAGMKLETFDNRFSATASYYNILVKDKLRADPANPNFYLQDANQKSRGFETEVTARLVSGLSILLGYGYNENVYTKAEPGIQGKRPYGTPAHLINGWISYTLPHGTLKGLGLGAGANYSSSSFAEDENLMTIPAYTVASAGIYYDRPAYRIGARLDNLTDEHYFGPFFQPQPTRSFSINLSYKFSAR